jgi:hypothetical protein
MNSMRCALSVALASSLTLLACKKDEAAAERAASPAPAAPESAAEPAAGTKGSEAPSATPERDPRLGAAQPGAADDRQVVALGGGGKAKVMPVGGKTVADTPTYTVTLAAPAKVGKGSQGTATLEILPKEGWKLNKEFPTKLTVNEPAGVKIKKKEQTVADAVAFADKSGKWTVEFQAESPGAKDFTGQVKFAVCTETSCDPKKEQLAFNVTVAE